MTRAQAEQTVTRHKPDRAWPWWFVLLVIVVGGIAGAGVPLLLMPPMPVVGR